MSQADTDFISECLSIITGAYINYAGWLWTQISEPFSAHNYFSILIILSCAAYILELLFPWRKQQARIRKDFWLDAFYMFFNFFIFGLIIFSALSQLTIFSLDSLLISLGITRGISQQTLPTLFKSLSSWQHLLLLFIIRDFIQWSVHRCLHRFNILWRFHKVHHSVTQMGFAAHLRYHWMENIFYNSVQFIPLALLGFHLVDFFTVAVITTAIGHLNHANIKIPLGPVRYILNNPQMHIWHHAKDIFENHPQGVNFGITLSCWDYLFKSAHIPSDGRDIDLGFEGIDDYPSGFLQQCTSGFKDS